MAAILLLPAADWNTAAKSNVGGKTVTKMLEYLPANVYICTMIMIMIT